MKKFFDEFCNDSAAQPLNPTNNFDSVALCIYPGVDNFLARYMLECITGITTGSDSKEDHPNFNVLKARNFKGEGSIENTSWIKQTSFPHTVGQEFKAAKCIVVCKSPFDVLWEKFEDKIRETNTTLGMNLIKENEKLFNAFLASESEKMQAFYEYWLGAPVPFFILRIEDILYDPERTLTQLFQFLFNLETLKGSQIENKIVMFLKYNKTYEAFLNCHIENYQRGLDNFTHLQKNIAIKVMKNELIKLGYINHKLAITFRDDKGFDKSEMEIAVDVESDEEKWYQGHNAVMIENAHQEYHVKRKYCLITFLKINSKKTKTKDDD